MGFDAPESSLKQICVDYLVIEYIRDLFSFDFCVEPAWALGNVANQSLIEILTSPRQKNFAQ